MLLSRLRLLLSLSLSPCFADGRSYIKFFGPYQVPYLISSHNRPFSDRPFSLSPTVEEDNLESCRGKKVEGREGRRKTRPSTVSPPQRSWGRAAGGVPAGRQEGSGGGGPGLALCWRANSLLIARWKREQTGWGRPLRPTKRKGRLAIGAKPQARVVDAESILVISRPGSARREWSGSNSLTGQCQGAGDRRRDPLFLSLSLSIYPNG